MKHSRVTISCLLVLALMLSACAHRPPGEENPDPLRAVNRPIFTFNEGWDRFIFGPIARGWKFITPDIVRTGFRNFFENTGSGARFVSSVGQGEGKAAGYTLFRLVMNSTAGIGGFVDIASMSGVPRYVEDSGKMFARWRIPPGPFIMVPLLGPSSPRDGVGLIADLAMNPMTWLAPIGSASIFVVNERAIGDERLEAARESALDFYVFQRNAYRQYRQRVVDHRGPADFRTKGFEFLGESKRPEDLYELDPEDELYDVPETDDGDAPTEAPPQAKAERASSRP